MTVDFSDPETYVTPNSLDELFIELSNKIEGFSGLYLGEDKNLVVGTIAPAEAALARRDYIEDVITQALDSNVIAEVAKTELGAPNIAFRQHNYSFKELNAWKNHAHKLFGNGVTFIDADEYKNRIVIGIEDETSKAGVVKAILEKPLPMPLAAIEFRVISTAEPLADNRLYNRPIVGGLAIAGSYGGCTLSYNATRLGTQGFITNSHCSNNMGWPDNTVQNQGGDPIGYELHDPSFDYSWWPWVCPIGFRCRESDSAFYNCSASKKRDHV